MADSSQSETDPSKISEEVVQELEEKGAIEESERGEFADSIHLQEMDVQADPSSTTVREMLSEKWNWSVDTVQHILSKTGSGEITKVTPAESGSRVVLHIKSSDSTSTHTLNTDSTRLANLLEYFSVSDPSDLEGETLPKKSMKYTLEDCWVVKYYVPNNVSSIGKSRFRLFSTLHSIQQKKLPSETAERFEEYCWYPAKAGILIATLLWLTTSFPIAFPVGVAFVFALPLIVFYLLTGVSDVVDRVVEYIESDSFSTI